MSINIRIVRETLDEETEMVGGVSAAGFHVLYFRPACCETWVYLGCFIIM